MKRNIITALKERDGLVCGICGGSMELNWQLYQEWLNAPPGQKPKRKLVGLTIDHKKPKSVIRHSPDFKYEKGWQWVDLDNLQLAHFSCNNKKGNAYTERES